MDLITEAITRLEQEIGLNTTWQHGDNLIEGIITLAYGNQTFTWQVKEKNRLTRPILAKLLQNDIIHNENTLLVAPYINENLAALCREQALNYVDLAGNIYLHRPPIWVDIRGRKPAPEHKDELTRKQLGKAFQPKGMKLVMMLLLNPELVNQPMRALAEQAEVALGTVKQVLDDLKTLNFIIDKGAKGKQLVEEERLLHRWLDAYPHNMAAKLAQALYTTDNIDALMHATLDQHNALWGGEVAAATYTHYLTPKTCLIYADANAQKALLKDFRLRKLRPEEQTDKLVRLVNPPVNLEKLQGPQPGMAAPLLVYAELLNSNDPRNLETAKRLYDDYLA